MTFSEIHNKPTNSSSEDLLTSDVFGCCSFLQYSDLLQHILEEAIHFESRKHFITHGPVISNDYLFWPKFQTVISQTEPDLLVILWHNEKECTLVIIESKYNSGKSSEANYELDEITDQLARELLIIEDRKIFSKIQKLSDINVKSKAVIYVTADDIMPKEPMNKSAREFFLKINNLQSIEYIPLYWLPWWKIENLILNKKLMSTNDVTKYRVIKHLWDVLCVKNFRRFLGLKPLIFNSISLSYTSDCKEKISDYIYNVNFLHIPFKYQLLKSEKTYKYHLNVGKFNYFFKKETVI